MKKTAEQVRKQFRQDVDELCTAIADACWKEYAVIRDQAVTLGDPQYYTLTQVHAVFRDHVDVEIIAVIVSGKAVSHDPK